jgi:uncharacterized SAM-binding protein YcdF (DUF218 family)
MFFILSKILAFITVPFFWILLLFAFALFGRKKYKRRKHFIRGIILLIFFTNSFIYKAVSEIWILDKQELAKNYDYGILLGGMVDINSDNDNIIFNTNGDRLLNTIYLYKTKTIKKIIISGASGSLYSDMSEANILKLYLQKIGISEDDILTESKSKNTYENAIFSADLIKLRDNNKAKCIIITSDYHIRRSLACFRKAGLDSDYFIIEKQNKFSNIENYIIPQASVLLNWQALMHEFIGYGIYWFQGYL